MLRGVALAVSFAAAVPAFAGEMTADEARRFVIGKMFNYECFEGTRGLGRVNADGSVTGSVQFRGTGPVRYAHLPAGTLHVKGESVCATLRGMPISPCFSLQKTSETSFRGAVYGLGFASCQFTRHMTRADISEDVHPAPARAVHAAHAAHTSTPAEQAHATNALQPAQQARATEEPLGLRPSLTAGAE
jgi:hypothetical protein